MSRVLLVHPMPILGKRKDDIVNVIMYTECKTVNRKHCLLRNCDGKIAHIMAPTGLYCRYCNYHFIDLDDFRREL